ncbi:hypothetical protein GCM10018793_50960 [Streptomyces sulfonofaciens]|uniref:Uncharacterized protein n=1 Tax=Streptomyces sulfonofaciens TaxID=68272 RepID=A0A919GHL6_9ACTN|nr:hypothetical protein GCM10018793_50960 [Streptomyces sulfonofaciens]
MRDIPRDRLRANREKGHAVVDGYGAASARTRRGTGAQAAGGGADAASTAGTDPAAGAGAAAEADAAAEEDAAAEGAGVVTGPPFAECVLCRAVTEYPRTHPGVTLCPVCEWQEAERTACSG